MFSNSFWKTLGEKRIQAIVGSAVEYSDSATIEHFALNAAEGEIGFFRADTNALLTTAIGDTIRFYIALKKDGRVHKTTPVLAGDITRSKVAYSAPVKQEIDIIGGTRATLTEGNIIYTSRVAGTGGNAITVTVVDPAGNNAALSVGVVGTAITVNLATDGASAPTSTGAQVLAALLASIDAMALVTVEGTGDMTTVQAAAGAANLAGGAAGTAPTVGDEYGLIIQDLTGAMQPIPTYQYYYIAKTGDTLTTVIAALAAKINSTTSVDNKDRDLIVDATATGERLNLKSKQFGTIFNVLIRKELADVASVVKSIMPKVGSGYYTQVAMLEEAGHIFEGWTTNYPETHTIPEDYGKPSSLVLSTNTYNMYAYTVLAREDSRTPHNVWHNRMFFAIAAPSNGTNPSAEIDTLLGF